MNKILKTFLGGALVASSLCADVARVEMGAGIWQQTPNGTFNTSDTSGVLSLDGTYTTDAKDSNEVYFWMLVKHPIPVLPNIRFEYVTLSDEGTFANTQSGASTSAVLNMNQLDFIPYYNLIDNTAWITLDLGLDIKVIQADAEVNTFPAYTNSETALLPLLYVRTRIEIPTTDIGLEADVKYISYDGSTVYDARAKFDYTFDITPVIQPGIEIGYRVQKFDVDSDDSKGTLEYSGIYAGATLRF